MASIVLTDVVFVAGGVDLSSRLRNLTINYTNPGADDTRMGHTTKVAKGSVYEWDGTAELQQDYGAGSVDATAFGLIGTTGTFSGKSTSGADAATNPNYNGTAYFIGYQPIKGSHGELATVSLAFKSAGPLTRDVTP